MKVVVLLSGGMDSATVLAWAVDQKMDVLKALNFQYGSKHNAKELVASGLVAAHYGLEIDFISLGFIAQHFKSALLISGDEIPEGHYADESMKKTVVPFRNGIMLSVAAGLAESYGAKGIILGNHFGDHAIYPDCRGTFIEPMKKAIKKGTYAQIELFSPFCSIDKTAIAKLGNSLGVPFEKTWTCYKGGKKHCGKCGSCVERKEAFYLSKLNDPVAYEN